MNRRSFLTRFASAIAVPLFVPEHAIRSILDNRSPHEVVLPSGSPLVPLVAMIGPGGDFSNLQAWQRALNDQCGGEESFGGEGAKSNGGAAKQVALYLTEVDVDSDTAVFKAGLAELQAALPICQHDTLYLNVCGPTENSTMLHPENAVDIRVEKSEKLEGPNT